MVAPGVLLTRTMFKLKRVPEPNRGVKPSFEKPDIRKVLIGPPPGRTLADTFQLLAVSPADVAGGFWKVATVESKVKSPWKPMILSLASIMETVIGWVKFVTDVSIVTTGNATSCTRAGNGVGDGDGLGDGDGDGLGETVGLGDGVGLGLGVGEGDGVGVGPDGINE